MGPSLALGFNLPFSKAVDMSSGLVGEELGLGFGCAYFGFLREMQGRFLIRVRPSAGAAILPPLEDSKPSSSQERKQEGCSEGERASSQ
ncbi:MAG: hypothetical protein ACI8T1_004604 [Verrucomicrobiales bacterium]|jgi:hypothetical protein